MELPNSNCHGVLHPRYTSPLETLLASPPGGPEGKYYWAPGYGGDVIGGGELVLVSACLTVSPLITGGQEHTHITKTEKCVASNDITNETYSNITKINISSNDIILMICPALRRLQRGEVLDLMIQMKSLNCFMDDTNDTLNEFTEGMMCGACLATW